jgi:PAS domain S-box-containing protein
MATDRTQPGCLVNPRTPHGAALLSAMLVGALGLAVLAVWALRSNPPGFVGGLAEPLAVSPTLGVALLGLALAVAAVQTGRSLRAESKRHRVTRAALALTRARLEATLEHMGDAHCRLDRDFRFVHVNPAAERALQRPAAGLLGRVLWDEFPAARETAFQRSLIEALASGEPFTIEETYEPWQRWFEVRGFPSAHGMAVFLRDVTARRGIERLEHTHGAMVVLDEAGLVMGWNQGASRLYGRSSQAMLGQAFKSLFEPHERVALRQALIGTRLDAAAPTELELYLPSPQGDTLWLLLSLSRISGPERGSELMVIHGLDSTPRRLAEDALRHALARSRAQSDRWLNLLRSGTEISRRLGQPGLLQHIVEDVRLLVGAHQAVLSLTGPQPPHQPNQAVALSAKYAAWRGLDAPPQKVGMVASVMQHGTPVRMTQRELEDHPHWTGFGTHAAEHPPMRGWLAAPLFGRDGETIGLLHLSDKYEGEFDAEDLAVAQQMAQMAAAAVEADRLLGRALIPADRPSAETTP